MNWINKLKEIMTTKGVNIEQLKNKIENNGKSLSRNSIGNILNARNSPKIETLQIIADALEIELWEMLTTEKEIISPEAIFGFIEFEGQVHKIKTRLDLKQLCEEIDNSQEEAPPSSEAYSEIQKTIEQTAKHFAPRKGKNTNSNKLSRRVFNKYNITICNKFDVLGQNDLKKDSIIWAFTSKHEARTAMLELTKRLDFKFNR